MSFLKIKKALVDAYVTGAFGLPTAFENQSFNPDKTKPWAEVNLAPKQPVAATLGSNGLDAHTGAMNINLNYPLNQGDEAALQKADQIAAKFKLGSRFSYQGQNVNITSCGRAKGKNVDGMFQIILTINWKSLTSR